MAQPGPPRPPTSNPTMNPTGYPTNQPYGTPGNVPRPPGPPRPSMPPRPTSSLPRPPGTVPRPPSNLPPRPTTSLPPTGTSQMSGPPTVNGVPPRPTGMPSAMPLGMPPTGAPSMPPTGMPPMQGPPTGMPPMQGPPTGMPSMQGPPPQVSSMQGVPSASPPMDQGYQGQGKRRHYPTSQPAGGAPEQSFGQPSSGYQPGVPAPVGQPMNQPPIGQPPMGQQPLGQSGFNQAQQQPGFGQPQPGQFNQPPAQPGFGQPPQQPGQFGQPQPGQFGQPQPGQFGQPQPGQFGQPQPGQFGQPQPGQFAQPGQAPAFAGQFGGPPQGQGMGQLTQQMGQMSMGGAVGGGLMNPTGQQVNAVSVFGAPPNVPELDGPAGQPWLLPTASVAGAPTGNTAGEYQSCTLGAIPLTSQLLNKSKLPLGVIITPYRVPHEGEEPVPIINPEQIVRCRRCRTYINPWVQFVEQGTRWRCNLCYLTNEVPAFFDWNSETRSHVDRMKRPELTHAVVEFVAPQEYMVRPPQPCVYFFVIDVSLAAVQSGMVATAARTILDNLDKIPNQDNRTKVGFLTVDSSLHFYSLNASSPDPQMLVVSDLEDVFVPKPDDLLVNLSETRKAVESFLSKVAGMFKSTTNTSNALGAALQVAYKLLAPIGGKIILLNSTLPNLGPGSLKPREDQKLLGTPKEVQLLQPQTMFYKNLAVDCSRAQVSVDVFLFGSGYSDVATLSTCARFTAGASYFYPVFNAGRAEDATKFSQEFSHFLAKPLGLEAVLRVRASKGLRMTAYHGNFFLRSTDLMALPNVNPDASYAVEVDIEENIQSQIVCFQTAVLHTSDNGERRIRVLTQAVPVTNNLHDVYAAADVKTMATLLTKKAVERAITSKLEDARDALFNKCVEIFAAYKQNMGGGGGAPLVITENLKLLPLLTLSMIKNIAFRPGAQVPSDVRSQALSAMYIYPTEMAINVLYPKFYPLHMLPPEAGKPGPDGQSVLPPMMNLTSERMERHGCYLMDTGNEVFIWISRGVSLELLQAIFDESNYDNIPLGKVAIPSTSNDFNQRINAILQKIRTTRLTMINVYPTVYVVKEDGDPALRMWFLSHLVEDRTDNSPSYPQFLGQLREAIAKIAP